MIVYGGGLVGLLVLILIIVLLLPDGASPHPLTPRTTP